MGTCYHVTLLLKNFQGFPLLCPSVAPKGVTGPSVPSSPCHPLTLATVGTKFSHTTGPLHMLLLLPEPYSPPCLSVKTYLPLRNHSPRHTVLASHN